MQYNSALESSGLSFLGNVSLLLFLINEAGLEGGTNEI